MCLSFSSWCMSRCLIRDEAPGCVLVSRAPCARSHQDPELVLGLPISPNAPVLFLAPRSPT
jgi:hypothetical protein